MRLNEKWDLKNPKTIAYLGVALATIEVSKLALDFLPNVEIVTFLFILYTLFFGKNTLLVALGFTLIECCFKGIQTWTLMYLYIWPLLVIIVCLARRRNAGYIFYCILSGVYGLLFGFFCSIPYLFIGGVRTAAAWWIAGLPYDAIHGGSNFVICLILFKPVYHVMKRILSS